MKRTLLLLLLYYRGFSQEINIPDNRPSISGKEILKHSWKASWITHPTVSGSAYGVFIFRKTFQLPAAPGHLLAYISGDNRYKLYVNGKYVTNGPARGDLLHWNYETIDLAPWLKAGENLIAAEVINYGDYRPLAQQTFQTAFIFQAEDSTYDELNTGKGNWKVAQNNSYHPIAITPSMVKGFYAAGPCDSVEAACYPFGWNEPGYNDSIYKSTCWESPAIAYADRSKQVEGVGRGYIYGAGLHLVPRTIPLPQRKPERFGSIVRADHPGERTFIAGKATVIPKNTKACFLLDMGYLTIGYPQLNISKGNGSTIKIIYAEALFGKDGKKGNRNITEDKEIQGYYDVYKPDGGEHRAFEPLWLRTFRFVQLDIQTGDEDLVIDDLYNQFSAYPFTQKATFATDDPRLTQIWDAAWRTARLCAGETYFDCPYYEQLQYIGDTRIEALISLNVTGDDRLMRNALELFDRSRIPDGLTLSRYPTNYPQIIPTYSLMWINMIHDYYMYRDDPGFIRQFSQGMVDVLNWFEKRIDKTGMLSGLEWWNFTDYTPDFNIGIPDGADNGHSALVSLQFALALQNASELFSYFGQPYHAARYTSLAAKIRSAVLRNCYDPKKGMIAETPARNRFSEHTSLLAILTNTIKQRDQASLLKKIIADTSIIKTTIYFKFYLFRCLQKTGLGDTYTNYLSPWYNMLSQGLTTFAETDIDPRSDCHGWSASPLFDLLHTVAGIQPASPGFKTVLIAPNFGSLHSIEARLPHPKGDIVAYLSKGPDDRIDGYVELPGQVTGIFRYKGRLIPLKGGSRQTIHLTLTNKHVPPNHKQKS